jgi:enoyl-CoA hydratase
VTPLESILLCERVDGVAIVTMNRPEVRNALSKELRKLLRTRIAELDADDTVRCIILTGTDPAFCAGVDLRELEQGTSDIEPVGPDTAPFASVSTPLIGAVNGPAYTGGLEIALTCHFLIASERATFADTHARLGVMPGWGMSVLLAEAIGVRRAREMSLSSLPVNAKTACEWGLVNRVVPHAELLSSATDLGLAISANDQQAVQRHVRLYDSQAGSRNVDAWRLESEAWIGIDQLKKSDAP